MVHAVVAFVLVFACLPLVYYAFALATALRFRRSSAPQPSRDFAPPVSVLKPIRGLDRHTRDHLASLCRQDYPEYEILFAVSEENDPSIPIIRQVTADFPDRSIRLIVDGSPLGPSSKVSKLCTLAREARYDFLIISDSDVTVPEGYLRAVVAPFRQHDVGAVTCLYRGAPDGGIWADLAALGISTDFVPGVLVARRVEGMSFTLGATMATTRTRLAEIGGFEALVEYCADDFELGQRIVKRGYRVELAACTVSTECAPGGFVDFFKHELRWGITLRHSRPWGYAGRMLITQGLPWSFGAAAVSPLPSLAAAYLIAYLALRLALAWEVGVACLSDETVRRRWWLVPLRDAIAFVVAIASFCSNRIDWRGRSFELQRGRLIPLND